MMTDYGDLPTHTGEPIHLRQRLPGEADDEIGAVEGDGIARMDQQILGGDEMVGRRPIDDTHRKQVQSHVPIESGNIGDDRARHRLGTVAELLLPFRVQTYDDTSRAKRQAVFGHRTQPAAALEGRSRLPGAGGNHQEDDPGGECGCDPRCDEDESPAHGRVPEALHAVSMARRAVGGDASVHGSRTATFGR